MTINIENKTDGSSVETKRIAALRIAAVAGVFSLIVLSLMFVNYTKRRTASPVLEKNLEILMVQFKDAPDNNALMQVIRRLDAQIRQERMSWLKFSRRGAFLLLGGIAIALASLKYAASLKEKTILLPNSADEQKLRQRQATLSRRAIGIGFIVLLLTGGLLALKSGGDYVTEETSGNYERALSCFGEVRRVLPDSIEAEAAIARATTC